MISKVFFGLYDKMKFSINKLRDLSFSSENITVILSRKTYLTFKLNIFTKDSAESIAVV